MAISDGRGPVEYDDIVEKQVSALTLLGDPDYRRTWLRQVEDRRSEFRWDDTGFPMVPVQLVRVADPTRGHCGWVPIVKGEIVARLDDTNRRDVERWLYRVGFTKVDSDRYTANPCCGDYSRYGTDQPALVGQIWRQLRARGIEANTSAIVALGDTVKGPNDPEPAGAHSLADYPPDAEIVSGEPLVVVIDTGLDPNVHRSGWLHEDDVTPADPTDDRDIDPVDAIDAAGAAGTDDVIDPCAGHGTFVAGVIRRVAPSAQVVMLRAVDSEGFASDAMVAAAICRAKDCFAAADNRGVLNLSLGGETPDNLIPPIIECALRSLPDDVVVVAAAGNEPTGMPVWPAASKRAISVAALDVDLHPAKWSNFGSTVDFTVRGEGIVSTFVKGTDASGDHYDVDDYGIWSGTSFATPQVAAQIAANIVARRNDPVESAVQDLRNRGVYTPGWGYVVDDVVLHG